MSFSMLFPKSVRLRVTDDNGRSRIIENIVGVDLIEEPAQLPFAGVPPIVPPPPVEGRAPRSAAIVVTDDVVRSFLGAHRDGEKMTPALRNELARVLSFMRKKLFGLTVATFSKPEVDRLGTALNDGVKPSDFCRAVVAASRDEWWRQQGDINVTQLLRHVGRLSKQYRSVRRVDPRRQLRGLLSAIATLDPIEGKRIKDAIETMNESDARAAVQRWGPRLTARKLEKTDGT